jgi:hypothetical protein
MEEKDVHDIPIMEPFIYFVERMHKINLLMCLNFWSFKSL